ncbi:MAG: DCL family protein [Nodosilinea sp.]
MGKARPVAFGEFYFKTVTKAKEAARNRINSYEYGDTLNPDDEDFFTSLLTLHSEYLEKIGKGVASIKVQRDDLTGSRCLFIYRVDGSKMIFSWVDCITPATLKQIVSSAFRRSIAILRES